MVQLDAADADTYRTRTKAFLDKWQLAIARWETEAAPLKGMMVVGYHKNMSYLNNWLGIREIGNLEPKPGLPPTTAHMSELLTRIAKEPVKAVVRSAYNDPRAAEWLSSNAKVPVVTLPFTVGGTDKAKDLFGLFDDTIARLLAVAK
jgi:zinc/manganese transport system substrate-binding protein